MPSHLKVLVNYVTGNINYTNWDINYINNKVTYIIIIRHVPQIHRQVVFGGKGRVQSRYFTREVIVVIIAGVISCTGSLGHTSSLVPNLLLVRT